MKTDKPLISIVMAIYEPDLDWLREQLISLNRQTYPNLELIMRDDCSAAVHYEDIARLAGECITAFKYEISRNEKNLAAIVTFESLTAGARGAYIAYCDQDDIWLPEKLDTLYKITDADTTLAYSDMYVIDACGRQIAESLKSVRPRLRYIEGPGLAELILFRNCVAGCAMMVRAETARAALPFPKDTVYDHWLAAVAAARGELSFCPKPLVRYRRHANNLTGVLAGLSTKEGYYAARVRPLIERERRFRELYELSPEASAFIKARLEKRFLPIVKYRKFSPRDAYFECAALLVPERLFKWWVKLIRKNCI
jgi:glycosyltransferase involved in cell wall biosynthesis